jgi:hypothetical protein
VTVAFRSQRCSGVAEFLRAFSVSGDELKYGDAASSAGGRVELVWRRAR